MNNDYYKLFIELNKSRLTNQEKENVLEKILGKEHEIKNSDKKLYEPFSVLNGISVPNYGLELSTFDDLLERDKQREKDGFPKKVKIGKIIKPSKEKNKVVVVPHTTEEKFYHDPRQNSQENGGSGDGEEGDVIGRAPIDSKGEDGETGPGGGDGEDHSVGSDAYEIGKILTKEFELPNLKEKGKKRSLTKFKYDLTDKNKGFGQVLDKKDTLKNIIKTNYLLGNIPKGGDIDLENLVIDPRDKVYKILSREREFEPQAVVFFLRDYSGSMWGKPTDIVVQQHLLIYSWLMYQYKKNVETRFILHDTEAKEVPDFYTYYNSSIAGGTRVSSAFKLTNEIVKEKNLAKDYNVYVFHGTDGDDWDTDGEETIEEITKILSYSSRVGITIAQGGWNELGKTTMQQYIEKSGLLKEKPNLIRLDYLNAEEADQERIIGGIKKLIS